jgi:hypothetical protein
MRAKVQMKNRVVAQRRTKFRDCPRKRKQVRAFSGPGDSRATSEVAVTDGINCSDQ